MDNDRMQMLCSVNLWPTAAGLQIDFGEETIDLALGPDLPPPADGWQFSTAFRLGDYLLLGLRHATALAFWILDRDGRLLAGEIGELIGRDPAFETALVEAVLATPTGIDARQPAHLDQLMDLATILEVTQPFIAAISWRFSPIDPQSSRARDLAEAFREINISDPAFETPVFPAYIGRRQLEAGTLAAKVGDVRYEWPLFIPYDGFFYAGYGEGGGERDLILLVGGHIKQAIGLIDLKRREVIAEGGLAAHYWPRVLLRSCLIAPFLDTDRRFGRSNKAASLLLRETHIGHYLWNELSTVDQLINEGYDLTVFVHAFANEPMYVVEDVFPSLSSRVVRGMNDAAIVKAILFGQRRFFPYSSFRLSAKLRERVLAISYQEAPALAARLATARAMGRLILLIGLRLENRVWINQEDGYAALLRHFSRLGIKTTIVMDGHNYLRGSSSFVTSHNELRREGELPEIIRQELAIVGALEAEFADDPVVEIVNLIPCRMAESIVASEEADYFVTHWGAGLAKYKWVPNKHGFVVSSADVLRYKNDMHIYDREPFVEGAIELDYIAPELVDDKKDDDGSLIRFADDFRQNFWIDPTDFVDAIMEVLPLKVTQEAAGR